MSDIVNLRQFKKRKARDAKETKAQENRTLYGRTGTEKTFDREQGRKQTNFLDHNRLEKLADTADKPNRENPDTRE